MDFTRPLAITISPKSGPLPRMETLADATRALTVNLPREHRKQAHWLRAGWALLKAAEEDVVKPELIADATQALLEALELEGWMSRAVDPPNKPPEPGPGSVGGAPDDTTPR